MRENNGPRSASSEPARRADVILFGGRHRSLDGVRKQLDELGLAVHGAKSASEVIWLLEAGEPEFAAIFVDGDGASGDRFELLAHVAQTHPRVARILMQSAPTAGDLDGCIVVDKHCIRDHMLRVLGTLIRLA